MIKLTPDIVYTRGSMTQTLRELTGGDITIVVLQETFCDYNGKNVWLRDAELWHKTQKFMFARTTIPADAANGKLNVLLSLGNKPLGDWLFKQDYRIVKREHSNATDRTTIFEVLGELITLEEQFIL